MSTPLAAERVRLLGLKKELLAGLLASFRRSAQLLQVDDMDAFDDEMEACRGITKKVDEVVLALNQIGAQAAPACHEAEALARSIDEIVRQIAIAQKECNDIAEQKLNAYGQQIKGIRRTKQGIEGYFSPFQKRDAVFVDAKK